MNPNNLTTDAPIALALSGGVDSAVSAYLLKQQGHNITAVFLECWHEAGCRSEHDRQDAMRVALQLDIPFKTLDFSKQYRQQVMTYFLSEYRAGRTPNPDVLCNKVIKFGLFYDWALQQGFEAVATGHYARIKTDPNSQKNKFLATGKDPIKDQTYFLHQLRQEQLDHIVFPIGHLLKDEVRQLARQTNLPVAQKKDSVGLCFVGEIDVAKFLEKKLGHNPGEIVTPEGEIIGKHQGLWFYTIGQRHGFSTNAKTIKKQTNWTDEQGDLPPLFVIEKNQTSNQLVVGPKPKTLTKQWQLQSLHQINPQLDPQHDWQKLPLLVKVRSTGKMFACQLKQIDSEIWQVTTQQSVQGIAAGQFAVFYTEENGAKKTKATKKNVSQKNGDHICLGGGVIG